MCHNEPQHSPVHLPFPHSPIPPFSHSPILLCSEWVAKLIEAKDKYNTTGVKIVSLELFSIEAAKVCPLQLVHAVLVSSGAPAGCPDRRG